MSQSEPLKPPLSRAERRVALGRRGATIWFTGLPAAGKTTLSAATERTLIAAGHLAYRLDGDEVRKELCRDLGFDRAGRAENVRRVAHVARVLADAGVLVLVALVSPYAADRALARELHGAIDLPFVEVFLDTPISICEQRDPKGMYARARRGELASFTGVDDPYEPPQSPELTVPAWPLERATQAVLSALEELAIV
jgi:bifunctional enzyme CysN/CysC